MQGAVSGQPDYMVVGHITRDLNQAGGFTIGGTAAYAARTARALGCSVRVVTSAPEDLHLGDVLPDVEILRVPAPAATTFENHYTRTGRVQTVRAVAASLTPDVVPSVWREAAAIVHLGPVAQECDPLLHDLFPGSFLGLTPQGWMRRWDEVGRVQPSPWDSAELLLPRADAVVLSEGDVGGDEGLIARWAAVAQVLAVTRGAAGCTVHSGGVGEDLPGFPVTEIDSTGAGDVFAAVFFVQLQRGYSPRAAARMANCVAAVSVTRPGLDGTPGPEELNRCRKFQL
jgi:sugar/nucleoside kinase (ribokinase family)